MNNNPLHCFHVALSYNGRDFCFHVFMGFMRAMVGVELDHQVRLKAFSFLESQVAVYGEVLPWQVLATGFLFEGNRIPLVGPQGIFKPQVLDLP
jgi:hypothetical protein